MSTISKIITHNGIFHADEVFALALIEHVMGVYPVERTRYISEQEYNDPSVWIIDVGGRYDLALHNMDHHQDKELDSACMLVLNYLYTSGHISADLYNELEADYANISLIDCNGYDELSGFAVNSLIKKMNNLPNGFDIAMNIARNYVKAAVDNVNKAAESRKIWDEGHVIYPYIRVCDAFPIHWKRYQEQRFLVYPNDGKWNLLSINSAEYPINATGREDFLHVNKFIAAYPTREDAIAAASHSSSVMN